MLSLIIGCGGWQASWRGEASVAMAELKDQLHTSARHIGMFRHQLSALHRATSAAALRAVVVDSVAALSQAAGLRIRVRV